MTGFMRRTFVLEFEDPSFNGLEVRTRSGSLGVLMRMQELMTMALGDPEHEMERVEFFHILAGDSDRILLSWNLLDEYGEPVKITSGQLAKEEWPMIREIARAWLRAVSSVPRPLSSGSSDGEQSADPQLDLDLGTLPMETLPPSSTEARATTGGEQEATTTDGFAPPSPWSWTSPPSSNAPSG